MFTHTTPREYVPAPRYRPTSFLGAVERVHKTEVVEAVFCPESLRPTLTAKSTTTQKTRTLHSLSALAAESFEKAEAWVLRCGATIKWQSS